MNTREKYEIDYEDMDDLQISDRIEWTEFKDNQILPDDLEPEPNDYDTEYGSLNFNREEC